ncbi:transcription initiation factor IIB [Halorarius halobius]|uniref:transcription initiation factor IIB n=1 Tax=Halorarius halobius TaxID=2962671 RepID=UPI0020CDEADA|nr:transcription initiation factor IIB family protein [Halorarius halobius]
MRLKQNQQRTKPRSNESASEDEQSKATQSESTDELQCPECATDEYLVVDDEETYCGACGLVLVCDTLDRRLRWVDTGDGQEPERGGAPTTHRLHHKGLPTEIGYDSDGYDRPLSSQTKRRFRRLRKWDSRSKAGSSRDRSLRLGLGEIARLISALELHGSIHDRAADLYREVSSEGMLAGNSVEGMATACVYAACRLERLPRTLKETGEVARVDTDEINRDYKNLNRDLELATPPPLPQDYVPRLASAVDASPRVERRAYQLARSNAVGVLANGRQPNGVAAACLYHASKESGRSNVRLTQQTLSEEGYTTPTTIRKLWKELKALADDEELPDPDGNLDHFS